MQALDRAATRLGDELGVSGPELLRERAEILGIAPAGTVSAGGSCRLFRARDGRWVALNLARRSDVELLPAWMEHECDGAPWDAVTAHLRAVDAEPAADRAQLLGIPAAVAVAASSGATPVRVTPGERRPRRGAPLVLDCSALWAGPLCARVLGGRGAVVRKVELTGRPDGARHGPPEFWERLNGAKEEVIVDRSALPTLFDTADVVVTSARPRAIDQLGLDLQRRVYEHGLVWVSITGYGFRHPWHDRVAFGDDAAVAGGLAVAAGGMTSPVFVGDAPADPLAGLHAVRAAVACITDGMGAFVDVSMRDAVSDAVATSDAPGRYVVSARGPERLDPVEEPMPSTTARPQQPKAQREVA